MMQHIRDAYEQAWPVAMIDYIAYSITHMLDSETFQNHLAKIYDPFSYPADQQNTDAVKAYYQARLAIPKLMLNTGNDDFFPPDLSELFINDLPGKQNFHFIAANRSHTFRYNEEAAQQPFDDSEN